jgi:hypothetical protein
VSDERGTLLLVTEKQQSRRRPHRCRRPANRKRGEAENLSGVSPLHVEPFEIEVPERTLSDLRERIRNTVASSERRSSATSRPAQGGSRGGGAYGLGGGRVAAHK